MNNKVKLFAILGAVAMSSQAHAEGFSLGGLSEPFANLSFQSPDQKFSINPTVGTLGTGLEASYRFAEKAALRGAYRQFSYDGDYEIEGEDFNVDLDLNTTGLMFDFYPTGESLRFTAGLLHNRSEASISGSYNGSFDFNGTTFTAPDATNLNGTVTYPDVAPVLSVGWNKHIGKNFALTAELGAMFMGGGDLSLSASGGVSGDPTFQAELEAERASLQDDISKIKVYPVIQVGAAFRF